jgi:hypothetical protein
MTGIMGQRSHAFHAGANGHSQDEMGRDAAGLDAAVDLLERWLGQSSRSTDNDVELF